MDNNDCRLLQEAAFDALELLHSTGIRHGDLDERNIRARREVSHRGDVTWKVWFIDLGLASFPKNWMILCKMTIPSGVPPAARETTSNDMGSITEYLAHAIRQAT